ncbi:iron complex transport system substrate-binding protein [bacterium A37T11]|nr:iron complex transport system substrate-binding protein [bacterium A37T11]
MTSVLKILLGVYCCFGSFIAIAQPKRIISLSGSITETVAALGFEKQIVAVDMTSAYPSSIATLPKASKGRGLSAEGLLSFMPNLLLAPKGAVSKELEYQLSSAGVRVVQLDQDYSLAGTATFIKAIGAALGVPQKGRQLAAENQQSVKQIQNTLHKSNPLPKVLFIYARGTGTMLVAGKKTSIDGMVDLAGGKNAVTSFEGFKPYTAESLARANPDVILMFDFGYKSLGGASDILKMPGIAQTPAGKNGRIVQMESTLLNNFSLRLPQAIKQLNQRIYGYD